MYELIFPEYYNDDLVQFEVESKGYLYGVKLQVDNFLYELVFYDCARLKQDAEEENKESFYFHEPNLIIIDRVTKKSIERAISKMIQNEEIKYLLKD